MPDVSPSLKDELASLKEGYRQRIPARLSEIDGAWSSWQGAGFGEVGYDDLVRFVHNLAGSAATYGFPDLGDVARRLERDLRLAHQTSSASPSLSGELAIRLRELRELCESAGRG